MLNWLIWVIFDEESKRVAGFMGLHLLRYAVCIAITAGLVMLMEWWSFGAKVPLQKPPSEIVAAYGEAKLVDAESIPKHRRLDLRQLFEELKAPRVFYSHYEVWIGVKATTGWTFYSVPVYMHTIRLRSQEDCIVALKPIATVKNAYAYLQRQHAKYAKQQKGFSQQGFIADHQLLNIDGICHQLFTQKGELAEKLKMKSLPTLPVDSREPIKSLVCAHCVDLGNSNKYFLTSTGVNANTEERRDLVQRVQNIIPATASFEQFNDREPYINIHDGVYGLLVSTISKSLREKDKVSNHGPVFIGDHNGETWRKLYILDKGRQNTDITAAMNSRNAVLSTALLSRPNKYIFKNMHHLQPEEDNYRSIWQNREREPDLDQPYLAVGQVNGQPIHVVGANEHVFDEASPNSARLLIFHHNAKKWFTHTIASRAAPYRYAPCVRPVVTHDGTIYAAMVRRIDTQTTGYLPSQVIVVREDAYDPESRRLFDDLRDPSDGKAGKIVVADCHVYMTGVGAMVRERTGSHLALAVHPSNSQFLALAWADSSGAGMNNLHLKLSFNGGETWTSTIATFTNITAPALSISAEGTVGLLYHQVSGSSNQDFGWKVKLWQFQTSTGERSIHHLATFTNNPIEHLTKESQPFLGEYAGLQYHRGNFCGVFIASNKPDSSMFPSGVQFLRYADWNSHKLYKSPDYDKDTTTIGLSLDPYYFSIKSLTK